MNLLLGLSLLFATGCGGLQGKTNEQRALLHLKIGISQLQKGNYPAALLDLLKAEKYDPRNPSIQNNLGLAYLVRGRFMDAETHFRKALHLKPKFTEARNNLGRTLVQQGSYPEAIKELRIATLDLTYNTPEKSWSNLGIAQFKDKRYGDAIESLKRSLDLRKDNCITFNFYGRSLFEKEKFDQAAIAFDKSIPLCKNMKFDEPSYFSALCYFKLGQPEESAARLEALIETYPNGAYVDKAKAMLEIIR